VATGVGVVGTVVTGGVGAGGFTTGVAVVGGGVIGVVVVVVGVVTGGPLGFADGGFGVSRLLGCGVDRLGLAGAVAAGRTIALGGTATRFGATLCG
jgi:hypothetical protein